MKKFLVFFVALVLMSVSIFSLSASAAYFCPTNYDILYTDTYSNMDFGQIPLGTLQRLRVGNDLVECYQPHTRLSDGRLVFETYGLFTHIFEKSTTVSLGGWSIKYTHYLDSSNNNYYSYVDFLLDGVSQNSYSYASTTESRTQYRYGFSLIEYNSKSYLAVFLHRVSDFPPSNFRSNPDYVLVSLDDSRFTSSNVSYYDSGTPSVFLLDLSAQGKSWSTEVDIEGGQSINDASVRAALTCPNCGGTNVTLIPQPMYDVGSEGGLIYKIRCNACQNFWHWTFTSNEKAIIDELNNDPESGFTVTYENPVSDNVGDIFDLPRDENGNVIWGEAAGSFGELMSGTFSGLSSAAVAVVSIFGSVFSFLPEGILALISFAIILCLFVGIFKTLRG